MSQCTYSFLAPPPLALQVAVSLVSLCQDLGQGQSSTRAAAQNTAVNTLTAFSRSGQPAARSFQTFPRLLCRPHSQAREFSVEEIIPVLQFLCSGLEESYLQDQGDKTGKRLRGERDFLLTCLEATLVALGRKVRHGFTAVVVQFLS